MTHNTAHAPSAQRASRAYVLLALASALTLALSGCAQRVSLDPSHALSFKRIFSAQGLAPEAKLATLNAEDSKGVIKRREKRKDAEATAGARSSQAASRAARSFSLGGR